MSVQFCPKSGCQLSSESLWAGLMQLTGNDALKILINFWQAHRNMYYLITSVTPGRPSLEVRSAGPHSLLLSIRRNESMECFGAPFEIVNRLEFVSQWDHETVSTTNVFKRLVKWLRIYCFCRERIIAIIFVKLNVGFHSCKIINIIRGIRQKLSYFDTNNR